jgi:hypothetical protein
LPAGQWGTLNGTQLLSSIALE